MIWGSLTVIVWFSLLYCFPFAAILAVQYIYSSLLVYTCHRIFALCTTWFVNSPFSYGEPSPIPSNYNKRAQGPCLSLGLDTIIVLIILCYTFCIVIKHLELLYMLQTIFVWKEFELDTCFIFYLWNIWIFFYKYVVEINVLFKCEVLIM